MKQKLLLLLFILSNVICATDNFIKKSDVSCPRTITYYDFAECETTEGVGSCIAIEIDFDCRWSSIVDNAIVEDATLKTQFQASDIVAENDRLAMESALQAIRCGTAVKSRMLVQNATKSLTDAQKITILNTYSDIDNLLSAGSLATARVKILEVVADGVMITDGDKTALVAELDKCI